MKRFSFLSALICTLLLLVSCGTGKWIDDGLAGEHPWLNYRTLDEYIEVISPHFFEGVAARGVSTINGSTAPLLMVDGFEVQNFDSIDLHDVVAVEIITDSRVAGYGVRGANGVALVTTKASRNANKKDRDRN
ncbi:MAG: hypothetical protein IJL93_04615 [Bacteroidales bacterium]|nr:hypothetical protein [Bacteroidales bacterium]